MKVWISLAALLSVFTVLAENTPPSSIEITGKFQFKMVDGNGQMQLGDYIKSASDITSSSACLLNFSADDDFYNSYSGGLNIVTEDNSNIIPYFQIESQYIDGNSRYWTKKIKQVTYRIGTYKISDESWSQETIKGNHFLFAPSIEQGQLAFHELSMGQPLLIEMTREELPKNITIIVPPLSSKVASFVRKCFKLMDENAVASNNKTAPEASSRSNNEEQVLGEDVKSEVRYAFELYKENEVKKAVKVLINTVTYSPYEEAYVARFVGVFLASSGDDNKLAISHLNKAVELNILKVADHAESLKLLADLNLSESHYAKALKSYNAWLAITDNDASVIQDRLDKIQVGLSSVEEIEH
ncbi:hypothetical protein EKO29_00595 [Colwellia sp. Arc7-635]|uniref:tetratricopeptide repeat protein n=1 Tax=Colwellia sp. Arc7-635 TaxID=2497879 RepID=UPI000F8503EA|nr:hypothetical protein [Colwellia sp. Arc7-635]AZQ82690.1 hypothetical protein EKO29_00595 [Colwellia sp. Arc7-635]